MKKITLVAFALAGLLAFGGDNGIHIVAENTDFIFPKTGEIPQQFIPGGSTSKDTRLTLWTMSSLASTIEACFQRFAFGNLFGTGEEVPYPESGFLGPIKLSIFTNDLLKAEVEDNPDSVPFAFDFYADMTNRTYTNTTRILSDIWTKKNDMQDQFMRALLENGNASYNPWNEWYHSGYWPYQGEPIYAWGSSYCIQGMVNLEPETDPSAEGPPEERGWMTTLYDADLGAGLLYATWADIFWKDKAGKTSDISEWLQPTISKLSNVKAEQTLEQYSNRQSTPNIMLLEQTVSNITYGVTGTRSLDKDKQSHRLVWAEWAWPLAFWKMVDIAYVKQDVLPQLSYKHETWYASSSTTFTEDLVADIGWHDGICYITNIREKTPQTNTTSDSQKLSEGTNQEIHFNVQQHSYDSTSLQLMTNVTVTIDKTNIMHTASSYGGIIPDNVGESQDLECYYGWEDNGPFAKIKQAMSDEVVMEKIENVADVPLQLNGSITTEVQMDFATDTDEWRTGDPYDRKGTSVPCLYPHPLVMAASADTPDIYVSAVQGYDDGMQTQSMIRVRKVGKFNQASDVNAEAKRTGMELFLMCKKVGAKISKLELYEMTEPNAVIAKSQSGAIEQFFRKVKPAIEGGEDATHMNAQFVPPGRYEICRVKQSEGAVKLEDFKLVYSETAKDKYSSLKRTETWQMTDVYRYFNTVYTRIRVSQKIYKDGTFVEEREISDDETSEDYDPSKHYEWGVKEEMTDEREEIDYDDTNWTEIDKVEITCPITLKSPEIVLEPDVNDCHITGYQHFTGAVKFTWKVCH